MHWTLDRNTYGRAGRLLQRQALVVGAAALICAAALQTPAAAEDDALQQAINYVFTGTIDPKDAPEIEDRKSCVVVLPDPKWKRFIRYYLARMGLDDPHFDSTYSGRQPRYLLEAQGDQVVLEYLSPDKKTVVNGYKTAQIPLPGDFEQTRRALALIASRCKRDETPKLPF
jgi:hypothetical protein